MSGFCMNCGAALEDEAQFCSQCGAKVFVPTCPNCGAEIAPDATFCTQCGQKVGKTSSESHCQQDSPPTDNNREKTVHTETDINEDKNTAEEQAKAAQAEYNGQLHDFAYVIGKNTEYYLPEFEKAERGAKVKWNWAAFLLAPMFCFYRKCGDLFKKNFLIPLIVENAGAVISLIGMAILSVQSTAAIVMMVGGILSLLAGAVWFFVNDIRFGLHFNELYYHHCCQMIASGNVKRCGTSVGYAILYAVVVNLIETILGVVLVIAMIPALLMGVQSSGTGSSSGYTDEQQAAMMEGTWLMTFEADGSQSKIFINTYNDSEHETEGSLDDDDYLNDTSFECTDGQFKLSNVDYASMGSFDIYFDIAWDGEDAFILTADRYEDENGTITIDPSVAEELKTISFERISQEEEDQNTQGNDTAIAAPNNTQSENGYSNDELCQMAKNYYRNRYGAEPPIVEVDSENGNQVTLHLYEDMGDHTATWDWYTVNKLTGIGTDLVGDDIDLTEENSQTTYFASEYLFPSNTQYISVSDLYDLSKDQVSLVLNEIYARHGCNFNSTNLRDYFNSQDWYYPVEGLNASNFDSSVLNDCEKENVATIVQYQKDQGWRS